MPHLPYSVPAEMRVIPISTFSTCEAIAAVPVDEGHTALCTVDVSR
jgi:hypothetical protein